MNLAHLLARTARVFPERAALAFGEREICSHGEVSRRAAAIAGSLLDLASEEHDRLCLESIARFKRPKEYLFLAALPKNNYGKVLKTELRRQWKPSGEN
jgi:acyl-CoA synthetase (AMP-forming)/AMP-acid ligase II